jgi:DNA invertase Pin-like site-specific DNA recombinase
MKKTFALYLRVSTDHQNTDMQRDDLVKWAEARGFNYKIYEDTGSGTNANRKKLQELLFDARSRKIDGVALWKMDRLFRSMKHAVLTLSEWTELGLDFYSHKDQIDMTTSTGRLLGHLLMAFAEWEADTIRTRVKSGLMAAKARGVKLGRPVKVTKDLLDQVWFLKNQNMSVRNIGKQVGLAKSTVQRILDMRTEKPLLEKAENINDSKGRK